jgi:cellulose synthase/poly-beta-1,6-N-acetylglucosamine synthase-like glycosyltransferase
MPESMEISIRWIVLGLYFGCLGLLTLYGIHRWFLVALYLRHRNRAAGPLGRFETPPRLTVQLPLYNEMYVARRLIDAVCALDYPRDRLEIQVLDDSTDETSGLVAEVVKQRQADGFDIVHLRRTMRIGFKAGALEAGQRRATGELIAVFDADFVPTPDFARQLVDHFTDPEVGMVQARWGHLNPDHSALTRVQSMFLDGHFVVEHTARNRSGRFFNFNGTAGIWRSSFEAGSSSSCPSMSHRPSSRSRWDRSRPSSTAGPRVRSRPRESSFRASCAAISRFASSRNRSRT